MPKFTNLENIILCNLFSSVDLKQFIYSINSFLNFLLIGSVLRAIIPPKPDINTRHKIKLTFFQNPSLKQRKGHNLFY